MDEGLYGLCTETDIRVKCRDETETFTLTDRGWDRSKQIVGRGLGIGNNRHTLRVDQTVPGLAPLLTRR
jgi:hypothetical protein